MKTREYELLRKRLDSIVGALDSIKEDIKDIGGFVTEDMSEEFEENLESAVISIQDCIENLDADEALKDLKDSTSEDESEEDE